MPRSRKKSWQDRRAVVVVIRAGQRLLLPVKLGKSAARKADNAYNAASVHSAWERWGLILLDLDPRIAAQLHLQADQGLIVVGVKPGSRAEATGLHQGDVIVAVQSAQQYHC